MEKLAIALLGAAGGVAIGFLITTATLLHNAWGYYLVLVGCGLVGALLTVWLAEWIIMIATAFFGSYLAIRGVSFYAGGFPSETSIVHMIKNGHVTFKSFDKIFYAYLGGIVALFVLTLIFQICRRSAIEERDEKRRYKKLAKREEQLRHFNTTTGGSN